MAEGWSHFAVRFSDYYNSLTQTNIWTPPRLKNREWMFVPWGNRIPKRHRSFRTKTELHDYIKKENPNSCFHSTAYYKDASERKMNDKGWLGADLIFDLDGDHLPGISTTDFPNLLDTIQNQAWKLWSDFLEPEFGFKEKYIQTSFSGHRGFHIHVRDPNLLHLDSNARREIVNFIRGEGIDTNLSLLGPDLSWGKRVRTGINSTFEKLAIINSDSDESDLELKRLYDITKLQTKKHIHGKNRASQSKIKELAKLSSDDQRISRLMDDNTLTVFGDDLTQIFWDLVRGDSSIVLNTAGETDEAVTVDTKRVIRWIGSLHGKSGLKVTEFPIERLDPESKNHFNALNEAVVFSSQKKKNIQIIEDNIFAEIKGDIVEGNNGDNREVTEAMATFLCLKGWAKII